MQQLTNIKEIETAVNEQGDMVITKSDNNIVVMSIEEYKKRLLDKEIEEKLLKSEEDYKNGRVKDADEVFKEWRAKYGV